MRRSARGEQSSAFSLFPFLAVLLCTMGALVVLLVAMAHVSRDKAEHEAEIAEQEQRANDSPEVKILEAELAKAKEYQVKVAQQRSLLEVKLAEEQERLTATEASIRRFQDEYRSLEAEALEIIALESTHIDDHEMATRELERLSNMITTLSNENAKLKVKTAKRQRRYAVIKLRDSTGGTNRPAIYFECHSQGITLQPEGIEFPRADFDIPRNNNSPFLAAVRAIRQYFLEHPESRAMNEQGEPYPLLVTRPDGVFAKRIASDLLDSNYLDYGIQLIDDEIELAYDMPNPELAKQVALASDLARQERALIAKSNPGLFVRNIWGVKEHNLFEHAEAAGISNKPNNPFSEAVYVPESRRSANQEATSIQQNTANRDSVLAYSNRSTRSYSVLDSTNKTTGKKLKQNGIPENLYASNGDNYQALGAPASPQNSNSTPSMNGESGGGKPSHELGDTHISGQVIEKEENKAAIYDSGEILEEEGIPMLRMVRLSVEEKSVSLIDSHSNSPEPSGITINTTGSPDTWMPQLLEALKNHANNWGIAGEGMYWKSSIILEINRGADQSAEKLANYLKRSDVEIGRIEIAQKPRVNDAKKR